MLCKYAPICQGRSEISIKLSMFAEHLLWTATLGTASEKCNFFEFLKVKLTVTIEVNVELIKLSWLTSKFEN